MKLPKESTLWKWVIIGLGLIVGVAVISMMNLLNDFLNSEFGDPLIAFKTDSVDLSNLIVYLSGKLLSIFTGCFTAGAIIKFLRPTIGFKSLLVTGLVFALLSLFDIILTTYPEWYQVTSTIAPIPSVFIGSFLIRNK